jgi:TamB, inner membrane protein subunit of TAM complex
MLVWHFRKTDLNHYKLLNTTRTAKSIYYGTGFATGPFALRGTLDQLVISADLKSDRGTRLFIPLDREYEQTDQGDYSFYSHSLAAAAELSQKPLMNQLKQDGITMDLNLAFTPEAYGEVQFDAKKGDIMRVYGMGNIKMTLDKKGDFKMNGDYAIDQGDYTFTLQNLINKKFVIQRGSKISWKGDPLEANVDIKAIYWIRLTRVICLNLSDVIRWMLPSICRIAYYLRISPSILACGIIPKTCI